jgi:hypothetical protein
VAIRFSYAKISAALIAECIYRKGKSSGRGLALGRVKGIEVEGLDLRRTIYLARNMRQPLTRAQERFWTFVIDRREVFTTEIRRLTESLRSNADR